ncbi:MULTISPECIES: ParA family protein [Cyanophyceae]|uniref:ParA family protein n=1 Tax=Cyanophyceae TaxID=3028117 RepID=UPI00016DCA40|nr:MULTISPECIES: ParA family protein [Cyanophyceae]ACB00219.1 CobQ/CobB nucleotide binding domain protein [Picosynechococcus sp. PCC 7002]ANV87992.1 cobyrinic acid a,c-diamide synthase [Picosynechococcus sp. PCC 7117]QCS50707.1 ParA family protein [Picosynechococcus sp. PCC 11901]SMH53011.1 Cellulose biosynthesis protein BcsQ [Picosynechococcus sp. OG1]SMQ82489.1 Cellulose biosynthesis protein BcsQ [Synechococcus sp. 7002]
MALIISTVNMKGGVGKTTLTVNLAACLARHHKKRVLVVDLDSQISATLSLMPPQDFARIRKGRRTISHLIEMAIKPTLKQSLDINDIICPYIANVQGLDLLPGDIELYDEYLVSEMLHQKAHKDPSLDFQAIWNNFELVLIRKILAPVMDKYDFIIMDCAPGYNLVTRSGLAASDFYILPARPEPLSVVGIQLLQRRIRALRDSHQDTDPRNIDPIKLDLLGIVFILSGGSLLNRYYNQVMKRVSDDFTSTQIFKYKIPMDVNVAKALDTFQPVVVSMPNTAGAKAFMKLTEEFLAKLKEAGGLAEQRPSRINLADIE